MADNRVIVMIEGPAQLADGVHDRLRESRHREIELHRIDYHELDQDGFYVRMDAPYFDSDPERVNPRRADRLVKWTWEVEVIARPPDIIPPLPPGSAERFLGLNPLEARLGAIAAGADVHLWTFGPYQFAGRVTRNDCRVIEFDNGAQVPYSQVVAFLVEKPGESTERSVEVI